MNQRLLELAIEARKYAETKPDIYQVAYDKKFAELLIRECIGTVSDCSVEYCTRPQIVSEIKQHFGVEE